MTVVQLLLTSHESRSVRKEDAAGWMSGGGFRDNGREKGQNPGVAHYRWLRSGV